MIFSWQTIGFPSKKHICWSNLVTRWSFLSPCASWSSWCTSCWARWCSTPGRAGTSSPPPTSASSPSPRSTPLSSSEMKSNSSCHQIGFGDLVPTRSFFAYEDSGLGGKLQVLAAVGYCVLGIAIVAMCISFIQVLPLSFNAQMAFPMLELLPILVWTSLALALHSKLIITRRELPRKWKRKGTRRKSWKWKWVKLR